MRGAGAIRLPLPPTCKPMERSDTGRPAPSRNVPLMAIVSTPSAMAMVGVTTMVEASRSTGPASMTVRVMGRVNRGTAGSLLRMCNAVGYVPLIRYWASRVRVRGVLASGASRPLSGSTMTQPGMSVATQVAPTMLPV